MLRSLSFGIALLTLSTMTAAQTTAITYVDADCSTNTTLADGTPYAPVASTANDNQWNLRAFANGGTILSASDIAPGEDVPMLRTTISGLVPGVPHLIYGYFWGVAGAAWRGRMVVDTVQPTPEITGYISINFVGTAFLPMQPLAYNAPIGANQTALGLTYDASGFETSGHFTNQVKIQEGNRWLYEVRLGQFLPDGNGEIHVYVDDLANQGNGNRTWFDGVGYEWAPLPFGNGCGANVPSIGYTGAPHMNSNFTVNLSGAPASALAVLSFGLSNVAWTGGVLPASLAFAGFPGCDLNVSPDVTIFTLTDPTGAAAHSVFLSGLPQLDLFWQWATLDASGLSATTGLQTSFHQ